MVAEKLDLTFDRFYFRCNFQIGEESAKRDHGNEFRGSKNSGNELWGGLKWPENGRKSGKLPVTHGGRRRRFAGPIPARPTAVGREILPAVASGCPLPPWPARVAGGWPEVPPSVRSSTARR